MPHCTTLQVEHKIQSSDGPLQLQLAMVTQPELTLGCKAAFVPTQMMTSVLHSADHRVHWAQVPKMLGTLRSTWAPEAFIVSFKLETDEQILKSKVNELLIG